METATPIEELAQITTRWQDTMLSLEKVYDRFDGSIECKQSGLG